jgi:threonine dehydratase
MGDLQIPSFTDVLGARRRIAPHLQPTPLYGYAALSELVVADVRVKHENHLPVGAFKVRAASTSWPSCPRKSARGVISA